MIAVNSNSWLTGRGHTETFCRNSFKWLLRNHRWTPVRCKHRKRMTFVSPRRSALTSSRGAHTSPSMLLKLAETESWGILETKLEKPVLISKPSVAQASDSGIRWLREKLSSSAVPKVPDWDCQSLKLWPPNSASSPVRSWGVWLQWF